MASDLIREAWQRQLAWAHQREREHDSNVEHLKGVRRRLGGDKWHLRSLIVMEEHNAAHAWADVQIALDELRRIKENTNET